MTNRRSVKDWLEDNEVYFRTVAAVLLSAMALYLAYQGNHLVLSQTKLLEKQTLLAEEEHRPHVVVDIQQYRAETVNSCCGYDYHVIVINDGDILENLSVSTMTYIEISRYTAGGNEAIFVPFFYLDTATQYSHASTGLLYVKGHGREDGAVGDFIQNEYGSWLYESLQKHENPLHVAVQFLVVVSYDDRQGQHYKYGYTSDGRGTTRTSMMGSTSLSERDLLNADVVVGLDDGIENAHALSMDLIRELWDAYRDSQW